MKIFNEHPNSVGETYWQHMHFAVRFSLRLLGASLAAIVHALLPFLFEKTASKIVKELADNTANRSS